MSHRPTTELRLLVVGVRWPPETFLARLIQGLAKRGVRITLAVPKIPAGFVPTSPNVDIMVVPGWEGAALRRLWRTGQRLGGAALRSAAETRHVYSKARASGIGPRGGSQFVERLHRWLPFAGRHHDVLYIPWNATAVDYLPLLDFGPSVISCRGSHINVAPLNPRRSALRDGLPLTFSKASAVHCVSEAIRQEAARYGLDRARSVVIRPAIDPDLFRPDGGKRRTDDGRFRVVSTGSIVWTKGFEYALSAVRRLADCGVPVQYDIIGHGPETQRLLYTIQDLGLDDHVIRHGKLPPEDVRTRLQEADVFLLSSLSEGISNAALEAMACGLPVVTTDVGGMSEAVTDGIEGFIVPSLDVEAMAAALDRLWRAPHLRQEMGAAGRARVLRDFRLDDQADAFVDLFRSVA